MRFTKGTKVEVFSTKEVPIGAWCCAEIVSGNGHTYSVKYGWFPMTINPVVENVPRRTIRPCPPPPTDVREGKFMVTGDVVEVFHNLSWKTAQVVDVIDGNYFLVRVFGVNLELRAHQSRLRIRQCWQDGKWFVVGKVISNPVLVKPIVEHDCLQLERSTEALKSCPASTRVLKRRSPDDSYNPVQKRRVMMGSDAGYERIPLHSSLNFEKVDTVNFAKQKLGENFMNSCFRVWTSACEPSSSPKDSISTISGDTYSCRSSVGSCSTIGSNAFWASEHVGRFNDDCLSDAESSSRWENEEKLPTFCSDEELGVEGHRSELIGYHYAIRALFTSGPLTWEDEARLTNLREQLQISDDEHLMAKHMGRKKLMLHQDLRFSVFEACIPCF